MAPAGNITHAVRGFSSLATKSSSPLDPVAPSSASEATALGAAYLAGLQEGVWPEQANLRQLAAVDRRFEPALDEGERRRRLRLWHRAVQAVIAFYTSNP